MKMVGGEGRAHDFGGIENYIIGRFDISVCIYGVRGDRYEDFRAITRSWRQTYQGRVLT